MAGAYAISLDAAVPSSPGIPFVVIPIVPVQRTGQIKFGRVWMSLAWDPGIYNANSQGAGATIRIWTSQGTVRWEGAITVPPGRRYTLEMQPEDVAVSIWSFGAHMTALVEYE